MNSSSRWSVAQSQNSSVFLVFSAITAGYGQDQISILHKNVPLVPCAKWSPWERCANNGNNALRRPELPLNTSSAKMPARGSTKFVPKKAPLRQQNPLSPTKGLDERTLKQDFGTDLGPVTMRLGTQQFSFVDGNWMHGMLLSAFNFFSLTCLNLPFQ